MSLYFENRYEAGKQLADKLARDNSEGDVVLICLNDGAVLVAEPIAQRIKAPILLLLTKEIDLPGQNMPGIGTIDQAGGFTYNTSLSSGEIDDYVTEYHGNIESDKIEKMHEINAMITAQGDIDRTYLVNKRIILVSDALATASLVDAAMAYLKPVKVKRIIAAVPVVSIPAVDRLHILTDEIKLLGVAANFFSTDHYYENNSLPNKDEIQQHLNAYHQFI